MLLGRGSLISSKSCSDGHPYWPLLDMGGWAGQNFLFAQKSTKGAIGRNQPTEHGFLTVDLLCSCLVIAWANRIRSGRNKSTRSTRILLSSVLLTGWLEGRTWYWTPLEVYPSRPTCLSLCTLVLLPVSFPPERTTIRVKASSGLGGLASKPQERCMPSIP